MSEVGRIQLVKNKMVFLLLDSVSRQRVRSTVLVVGCAIVFALIPAANGTALSTLDSVHCVRGLGLRGGRAVQGDEARKKPFDENTDASGVILRDWKKREKQPPSSLETLLAETLFKLSSNDRSDFVGGARIHSVSLLQALKKTLPADVHWCAYGMRVLEQERKWR